MKCPGIFGRRMGLLALHFRAFCHETEEPERVHQAFSFVTGGAEVEVEETEGHHGNRIIILESHIKDKKGVRVFFARMATEDIEEVLRTLEARVDEEGSIYLRFDKQQAFLGELRMGTVDDPVAVRGKIESYPRKRENDLASAKSFFEQVLSKRIN